MGKEMKDRDAAGATEHLLDRVGQMRLNYVQEIGCDTIFPHLKGTDCLRTGL